MKTNFWQYCEKVNYVIPTEIILLNSVLIYEYFQTHKKSSTCIRDYLHTDKFKLLL